MMERLHAVQDSFLSLLAEIILDESLRQFHIDYLYHRIDQALDNGDPLLFKDLTSQLNQLLLR